MFFAKLRIEIEYSAGHADLPFFICENGAKNVIFSLKRDCRHLQKTVSENGYHSRRHKNVISATACIPDGIYKFVTFLYKLGYLMPVSNGLPEYLQICEPGFEAPQR